MVIYTATCGALDAFANLACDLQPAKWISSNGSSVTIASFTGGGFMSTNVTLTCDPASSPAPSSRRPACVTLTAGSSAELLALMAYNDSLPGGAAAAAALPPSPDRLHIALTANISLDLAAWTATYPVVTRTQTTLAAADCHGVTAVDLRGGLRLMRAADGGVLRFVCLELSNIATDTLSSSMPRSLLSAAVWAVDVDMANRSRLVIEDCSLVMTKDEYKWQSYYLAQSLTNSAVFGSITSVLPAFQGVVSPSQLLWMNVSSPHTLWRNCILTSLPRVYETTIPNSFIMRYLGLSLYIADLKMVYTCTDLLYAVRNASAAAAAAAAPPAPRALVLGANISIGPCWPAAAPVAVTGPSLMIMGLPDVTTTLDLAGRSDAFELAYGTAVSLRFLTLIGLGMHDDAVEEDVILASSPPPSGSPSLAHAASAAAAATAASKVPGEELSRATALLWAFHFVRRNVQVQLEGVSIVVPAVELQQYDNMRNGPGVTVPYFAALEVYLGASSQAAVQPRVDGAANASLEPADGGPRVLASLAFSSLLLPGIRGTDIAISVWSGQYGNWSASMYDVIDGGGTGGGTAGGDGGGGGGGLEGWRVGVLAAAIGLAVLTVLVAGLLYGKRWRAAIGGGAAAAAAGVAKRRGDLEAGDGGRTTAAGLSVGAGGGAGGAAVAAARRPLYDSFDDPAFELDLVRGAKLSPEDVADILERVNAEAAEFNIQMTEICGSGAFGVVYGGMWHGLKVAIKTMVFSETAPPLLGGQLARQQCIREAAFCCTMHHPNVVATHHYYLKSAKRHTMFDDILQQMDEHSSDEGDRRRRRSPPQRRAIAALSPPPAAATVPMPMEGVGLADQATEAAASAADEGMPAEAQGTGDDNPGAVSATPAAAAAAAAPGKGPAPRRSFGRSALPRYRLNRNKAAVTDWRLYLIQEYCDGGTLRQAVDEGKLFRHSGMKQRAAGGAAADADAAGRAAGTGSKASGGLPADSLDGVQTLMIIGKQGQVTYDRFVTPDGADDAIADGEAGDAGTEGAVADGGEGGGGTTAVAPDDTDLMGPIDKLLPLIDDPAEAEDRMADEQLQSEAVTAAATSRPNVVQCLCRPTTLTLDSNFNNTTMTNATGDSTILATRASDVIPVQPTLPAMPPLQRQQQQPARAARLPTRPATATLVGAGGAGAAAPALLPAPGPPEEPLPADLALVIHTALGIASGVAYLHSRNIIHGDLSANNVLLMKTKIEDVPVLAKLSDFGLSMRLEQGQDHLKDVHHGTPYYQSPEVAEQGTCSLMADVYSLGVLLWELYHGQPPWRAKKHKPRNPAPSTPSDESPPAAGAKAAAAARAAAAVDGDLWDDPHYQLRACDVLAISPNCPERYARVLRRCLSPDPRDRPSARAVVKSLLRMERSLAAAAAGDRTCWTGAPVGAMMALTRQAVAVPGRTQDAALLLEDFDAAAAAVAAAVARVTAAPTVAGASASAGAAAAAVAAAAAGAASGSLLPVLDSSPQLLAAAAAARAAPRQRPEAAAVKGLLAAAAATAAASPGASAFSVTATATVTPSPTAGTAAAAERDAHVKTL